MTHPAPVQATPPHCPLIDDADFTLYGGDAINVLRTLPDESVHCCISSPPYWGLRSYLAEGHDDKPLELGTEPTPEAYVARMVEVFREVRRVLRRDGTCWLNIGDSYASAFSCERRNVIGSGSPDATVNRANRLTGGLKEKDLVGIPWRLAFALQADGWYLRSDIIWAKPNPMPESVTDRPTKSHEYLFLLTKQPRYFYDATAIAEPARWFGPNGQPKLGPHAGQMKGRAGKGHTPVSWEARKAAGGGSGNVGRSDNYQGGVHGEGISHELGDGLTRNARSVWEIQTQQFADAHFATFPEELPRRCIAAGTSEHGCCPECGAPWERRITATGPDGRTAEVVGGKAYDADGKPLMGDNMFDHGTRGSFNSAGATLKRETTGWRPTCTHRQAFTSGDSELERAYGPVPCVVLDPFMGSGTVALVARKLGRRSIGIELNPEYAELAARRLQQLSLLA